MRALIKTIAAILLAHLAVTTIAVAQETYTNPGIGFTAVKPAGWHNLSADQISANIERFDDPKIRTFVTRHNASAIFAVAKYEQRTYTTLNPNVQVKVRNLPPVPPVKGMGFVLQALRQLAKDVVVMDSPVETTVGSKTAAYMRVNLTAELSGRQLPVTSEMWCIPHRGIYLIITATTLQDESNATRAELRKVIDSIRLD